MSEDLNQAIDPIDALLNQLEEDKTEQRDFDGVIKLQMGYSDNFGMVMMAPFQGDIDGNKSFYTLISRVKEYKCPISLINKGESPVWVRILPKNFYGQLTPEQSELYDKVVNLYDQVNEKHTESDSWKVIRARDYTLIYGVLLKHINNEGKEISDNVKKGVLFIYPSKAPVNELGLAIKNKTNALSGNKSWVSNVFDVRGDLREGALIINFMRPETGAYQAQVSFEFNSSFNKIVEKEYPESVTKHFKDPVKDFLGWESAKSGEKFNSDLFRELGKFLAVELAGPAAPSVETPAPENKNGQDPVLTPEATPLAATDPQPAAEPAIKGESKLPF